MVDGSTVGLADTEAVGLACLRWWWWGDSRKAWNSNHWSKGANISTFWELKGMLERTSWKSALSVTHHYIYTRSFLHDIIYTLISQYPLATISSWGPILYTLTTLAWTTSFLDECYHSSWALLEKIRKLEWMPPLYIHDMWSQLTSHFSSTMDEGENTLIFISEHTLIHNSIWNNSVYIKCLTSALRKWLSHHQPTFY